MAKEMGRNNVDAAKTVGNQHLDSNGDREPISDKKCSPGKKPVKGKSQ